MTIKKKPSEEEKLRAKWSQNWQNEWQWIFDAATKEYDAKKATGKQKLLGKFLGEYEFFMELGKNSYVNKDGQHENKTIVNQYVSNSDKVEYRSINFDAIGKKAKLVTIAHGSKAGMEAYLKSFSTKLSKEENLDVHHRFFTDTLLNIQPNSMGLDADGKENFTCTIQTSNGLASFHLSKRVDKNGVATGKISGYKEISDIPSFAPRIK